LLLKKNEPKKQKYVPEPERWCMPYKMDDQPKKYGKKDFFPEEMTQADFDEEEVTAGDQALPEEPEAEIIKPPKSNFKKRKLDEAQRKLDEVMNPKTVVFKS
jgi:hypothetical protein